MYIYIHICLIDIHIYIYVSIYLHIHILADSSGPVVASVVYFPAIPVPYTPAMTPDPTQKEIRKASIETVLSFDCFSNHYLLLSWTIKDHMS